MDYNAIWNELQSGAPEEVQVGIVEILELSPEVMSVAATALRDAKIKEVKDKVAYVLDRMDNVHLNIESTDHRYEYNDLDYMECQIDTIEHTLNTITDILRKYWENQ